MGGNIGYRKSQDTYYYGSTSFGSAKKVINYFDKFHLLSSKHVNYLKWRKAYLIIQNKDHLNKDGIEKIINLKMANKNIFKRLLNAGLRAYSLPTLPDNILKIQSYPIIRIFRFLVGFSFVILLSKSYLNYHYYYSYCLLLLLLFNCFFNFGFFLI